MVVSAHYKSLLLLLLLLYSNFYFNYLDLFGEYVLVTVRYLLNMKSNVLKFR